MNRIVWTEEDILFLRDNIKRMSCKEIAKRLNRSVDSIYHKKLRIGLKGHSRYKERDWTEEEVLFMKNNHTQISSSDLSKRFNRTTSSILNKKFMLGLKGGVCVGGGSNWKESDFKILMDNYNNLGNIEIGMMLNKTPAQISSKLRNLNLHRPKSWMSDRMKSNNPMYKKENIEKMKKTIKERYPNWGDFNIGTNRPKLSEWNRNNVKYGRDHPCWNRIYKKECKECGKPLEFSPCFKEQKFCNADCYHSYLRKHGHSEEVMIAIRENRKHQTFPKRDSFIEMKIQNFLKELCIEFVKHKYMNIKNGYQCDIFIPTMNLVIECDGDYWHGNSDIFPNSRLTDRIINQRTIDKNRVNELIQAGFLVLRMWEYEIISMDIKNFLDKLSNVPQLQLNKKFS